MKKSFWIQLCLMPFALLWFCIAAYSRLKTGDVGTALVWICIGLLAAFGSILVFSFGQLNANRKVEWYSKLAIHVIRFCMGSVIGLCLVWLCQAIVEFEFSAAGIGRMAIHFAVIAFFITVSRVLYDLVHEYLYDRYFVA